MILLKIVIRIVKRIVLSVFVIYGYNLIAVSFNQVIPMNFFTVGAIGILGFPALFALILLRVFLF